VVLTQAEGDPYELLETYQEELRFLERLSGQPIPLDPQDQIDFIRKITRYSGEGAGNVLDVRHVSERRGYPGAESLNEGELVRLVGTSRPTAGQARQAVERINKDLGRGEAVCFPIYEGPVGEPVGWCFVGNTID
jgi:hypothetical protein